MRNRLLLIIGAASIAVCTTPAEPCACQPSRTHVVVYGTVRTSAGAAVPAAQVFVLPTPVGASTGDALNSLDGAASAADGSYRVEAVSYFSPSEPIAVNAAAVKAPGDTTRAATTGGSLRPVEQAADSVRLDLVFP